MLTLIAIIIFLGSIFGIGIMIFKKIPVLAEMPEMAEGQKKESLIFKLKEKCKTLPVIRDICSGILLQKTLSKIRVLTLKIETKTGSWLQKLRIKSQTEKTKENDSYWSEVKNEVKSEANGQIKNETKNEAKNEVKNEPDDKEEKNR